MNTYVWANIFLGCFLFGFVLTVISLLFGLGNSDGNVHGGNGHDGMFSSDGNAHGGVFVGSGTDASTGIDGSHGDGNTGGQDDLNLLHLLKYFNYNTILMFLTWFGAAGYVLLVGGRGTAVVVFSGAAAAGFIGSLIVFLFLHKFLLKGETRMKPGDYYLPGTLARIASPIREGGTGEIVYVQGGTRKTTGARSEDAVAHAQGEEVVIIRCEKGIAYVRAPTYKQHLTTEFEPVSQTVKSQIQRRIEE
ncbi:MAG: hypothetical protein ACR2IE_12515 [Candidatus Sumerlaeaceae bacterium]